jgi:hypothetical protein
MRINRSIEVITFVLTILCFLFFGKDSQQQFVGAYSIADWILGLSPSSLFMYVRGRRLEHENRSIDCIAFLTNLFFENGDRQQ